MARRAHYGSGVSRCTRGVHKTDASRRPAALSVDVLLACFESSALGVFLVSFWQVCSELLDRFAFLGEGCGRLFFILVLSDRTAVALPRSANGKHGRASFFAELQTTTVSYVSASTLAESTHHRRPRQRALFRFAHAASSRQARRGAQRAQRRRSRTPPHLLAERDACG